MATNASVEIVTTDLVQQTTVIRLVKATAHRFVADLGHSASTQVNHFTRLMGRHTHETFTVLVP